MRLLAILILIGGLGLADDISEARGRMLLAPGQGFDFTSEERSPNPSEAAMSMTTYDVRFPSPAPSGIAENDTIPGTLFVPAGGADRAVIFLPWFKDRDEKNAELICRTLAGNGFEVFFMPLGYQYGRAPKGHGSGSYITKGGPDHIQRWVEQSVLDVQRTREWIVAERGIAPERVSLVGISLGGFIGSLTYGLCPEFETAVICLAGGNLAKWVKIGSDLGISAIRDELGKHGVTAESLEDLVRPYDPVTHADPERKEGLLLINGLFDPLVPIVVAQELWEAWGQPRRMLLPSGHVTTVVFSPILLVRMIAHLQERNPPR